MDWVAISSIVIGTAATVWAAIYAKRSQPPTPIIDSIESGTLDQTEWAWVSFRVINPAPISWVIESAKINRPNAAVITSDSAVQPDPILGGDPDPTRLHRNTLSKTVRINWPLAPCGKRSNGLIAGTSDEARVGLWIYSDRREFSRVSISLTFRSTDAIQKAKTVQLTPKIIEKSLA